MTLFGWAELGLLCRTQLCFARRPLNHDHDITKSYYDLPYCEARSQRNQRGKALLDLVRRQGGTIKTRLDRQNTEKQYPGDTYYFGATYFGWVRKPIEQSNRLELAVCGTLGAP